MKTTYNKLVSDRVPDIIEADGKIAQIEVLSKSDFRRELLQKLVEEAQEAQNAEPEELATELADVLEVFNTVVEAFGLTPSEVMYRQKERRETRSGFAKRIKLIKVNG